MNHDQAACILVPECNHQVMFAGNDTCGVGDYENTFCFILAGALRCFCCNSLYVVDLWESANHIHFKGDFSITIGHSSGMDVKL